MSSEVDYLRYVDELVRKYNTSFKGRFRFIFASLTGSKSFNLSVATSDEDYWGVYVAPIEDVLSIAALRGVYDHRDPDYVVNEVGKYCEYLLKGNPKVIEPLFAERFFSQTKEWEQLKKFRNFALVQNTVDQYIGYAIFQLAHKKDSDSTTKNFKPYYHAFRVLFEAEQIALGNRPIIWFEGEKRDFLLSIRNGEIDEKKLNELFTEKKKLVDDIKGNLPQEIDITQLDQWLVGIRMDCLSKCPIEDNTLLHVAHNNAPLFQKCQQLLDSANIRGRVLCCVPAGSRTYGLELPTSSFDYVGIFVAPTSSVVSMIKGQTRLCELAESTVGDTYVRHLVLFELSLACNLLLSGNHRLIEALFFEDQPHEEHLLSFATNAWLQLKSSKHLFLSGTAVQHYVGVSTGQIKSNNCNIYQALRLTLEAERISRGEPPRIKFEGEERENLLKVREGSSLAEVTTTVQQKNKEISANKASWKVPSKCQAFDLLNKWQFEVRKLVL